MLQCPAAHQEELSLKILRAVFALVFALEVSLDGEVAVRRSVILAHSLVLGCDLSGSGGALRAPRVCNRAEKFILFEAKSHSGPLDSLHRVVTQFLTRSNNPAPGLTS